MTPDFSNIRSVACIGEAMLELRLKNGGKATVGYAGDTLNTAIYLKRMWPNGMVSFVTALGTEPVSEQMLTFIDAHNIDTTHIARFPNRNAGLYAISLDKNGERTFTYWREASAARQMFSQNGGLAFAALAKFDLLYLSAISLAILPENDRERLHTFLKNYRASGGLIAFDSNYRPQLWPSQAAARKAIKRMWHITDLAFPSLDDEMALFADKDEDAALARLARWGLTCGALKRGAISPRPLSGHRYAISFNPAQKVKDTTAAGDSFNAAYMATLFIGGAEQDCMLAGHALARHVIGHRGAIAPQ